ncbi:MAG: methyltransferase [Deltaproteobacteria bacterium]
MNTATDPRDLIKIMRGFMESKTLFTAHEMGLFDALEKGAKTVTELAWELRASERGVRALANALAAMGALVKEGDKYELPDNLRGALLSGGDSSLRNYMELLHYFWYVWSDASKVVRSGKPVVTMKELYSHDEAEFKTFARGMHEIAREASRAILKSVDISSRRRMLDVGGGAGTYSLEWAKRYPLLRAMVFDLPKALDVAREYIKKYDLEDRVSCIAGDFAALDFDKLNYDLILLANILQMFSPDENMKLLKKVHDALEVGGMVVIHGFAMDEKEYRPLPSAVFALSVMSVTPEGDAYKRSDIIKWLQKLGFRNIRFYEIEAIPSSVITALK